MKKSKRCVVLCAHDDYWFVRRSIEAAKPFGPVLAFVSRKAWSGEPGCFERVVEEAEAAGAEVILGDWDNETEHRRTALAAALERGYAYALIPDGDEVVEPMLLDSLIKIADAGLAERVHAHMDTYWKSARYVIRPREQLTPAIVLKLDAVQHVYIRDFQGGRAIVLGPEHGVIHHLSYAGPDERILRKITTWSHKHELVRDWYRNVWHGWDSDKLLNNLHPTHPQAYGFTERVEIPEILQGVWDERPVAEPNPERPENWPKLSIVIPLHGGEDDIRLCLQSLEKCADLIHETIVVDDLSPDNAASVAEEFNVILVKNETNLGFGLTCNKGVEASTGDVILFLNSDTVVPRTGLVKLTLGLMESGSIGAAGPMSNNVGYHQRIAPTYTTLGTLDLFAADLAQSGAGSRDVEILVGFALAVRKSVLNEVGLFDDRFGAGLFEDTDLCYRMLRAGYRLRMVGTAYVHHWGSRTLTRVIPDISKLLEGNGKLYRDKWKLDIETGFASYLPGFALNPEVVRFNEDRRPDRVRKNLEKLKSEAKISLCMIVKNEERVLAQCLESAMPYFFEVIVVDTGSTDRTKEIAREFGVKLIESSWPDSFAEARNESLSHATGDWIFWLDADDVLPLASGEAVVHAALNAAPDITGFVVPVQFVEEGPNAGTKVDHVKLIRNFPGIRFEGRIHEQILSSIRQHGGEIVRLNAVVLHAGYDTSAKGQANKRVRDWHLLNLDLQDRPEHPFVWFNIGMTHHYTGGHNEAVEALRNSIRFSGEQDSHLRKAYSLMGVSLRELKRYEDAEQAFREGLAKVGEDPELVFQLAMTATAQGKLLEAKNLYENMPQDTGGYFSSMDIGILSFKRLHNLGGIKMALGDYVAARRDWMEAFNLNPHLALSLIALADAALEMGDYNTARQSLEDIARIEGHQIDWAERRAKLADLTQEPGGSIGAMNHYLQARPDDIGPRLMVARHLLASGHVDAALPHLQILERKGVAEAAFMLGVHSLQRGDVTSAIRWMERAVELNPDHAQSVEQLEKLRLLVSEAPASILCEDEQKALLIGPDAGTLAKPSMRHSIVIVTYNSAEWIKPCLGSILPTLSPNDEVIIVDNGSGDDTVSVTESLALPNVNVISNPENIGYARAANIGIRNSRGEYVTLLNPDTEVSPGWLEGLASRLKDGIGAVGPVSDNIGGAQFVGHYIEPGIAISELPKVVRQGYDGRSVDTRLLMGMCLMVSRRVFNEVGLLDENLFLGADDLDLSWRLKCLGYDLLVALDVFVHHAGQKSFETRERSEVSDFVAQSDANLITKLTRFYGPNLPNSHVLWECDIFDEALQRFSLK
ncbi:MAG: glycosyltransferase [Armatimonadetes bacterium]|nr:glycosyltransferase [Armatimonadota bacterium]